VHAIKNFRHAQFFVKCFDVFHQWLNKNKENNKGRKWSSAAATADDKKEMHSRTESNPWNDIPPALHDRAAAQFPPLCKAYLWLNFVWLMRLEMHSWADLVLARCSPAAISHFSIQFLFSKGPFCDVIDIYVLEHILINFFKTRDIEANYLISKSTNFSVLNKKDQNHLIST
jgi:hypothetical protein